MSQIEHELRIRSPIGDLLDIVTDGYFAGLTYTLKDNEPGVLDLTLSGDFDRSKLKIDGQIEVRRSVGGGSLILEGDTSFFIRKVSKGENSDGTTSIQLTAYSALDILRRRIVAYFAGTSYAEKVQVAWDDMLKEIVRENYGSGASYYDSIGGAAGRDLRPWMEVEVDYHWGTQYTHSMPWSVVLDALQEIVNDVRSQGTYCTFDVIRTDAAEFEFRVFIGARGVDHTISSANPVIVSEEQGNLTVPYHDEDWQAERNFIYAAGQGQESARVLETAQDDARIGISPFNRQEYLEDSRNTELEDSVQANANAALETGRPKRNFSGMIVQTEGCMYGVHWSWGDIVTAEYDGESFDCYVTTVTVTINANGTEIVTGELRSVEDVN